jgi:hypothetical protein
MVRKRNYYIFTFACILLASCAGFLEMFDDKLHLQQKKYNESHLRIDGYYYTDVENNYKDIFFFYSNGVLLNIGGSKGGYDEISKHISREFNTTSSYEEVKSNWGLFNIENETMKFEKWYPGEVSKTFIREGKVLNDTTFKITESYRPTKGKSKTLSHRNEVYHFKRFHPKPDSTNKFIQ